MMIWIALHPGFEPEMLGIIPSFLDDADPRSAAEQIEANYIGGWMPHPGGKMLSNGIYSYPGDPPLRPLAETRLRKEIILFYDYALLAIIQLDGSFEIARLD